MKAEIIINRNFTKGNIDRRIYGSFIEHLGRAVYNGIYEDGHPKADDMGFRTDVLDLVKQLKVPIVRYPGGNFVSGYNWEDGIGDKSKRPKKADLAWKMIETNQVGIDEFQEWAKRAGTDVMMAVNLGTRGPQEAKDLVEYCNLDTDTYYANLRKQNGFEKPFGYKVWCLGNEMDGPWQLGAKTATEYARIATETAKMMKIADSSIELVVCGSSGYFMDTFGDWELEVLNHAYEHVDYISLHTYYNNAAEDTADYLANSMDMDKFIKSVAAICDVVKAKKHSDKTVNLSFDEWNVWYTNAERCPWWKTGEPLVENTYTFEDALMVGCMMITLQNNSDRVKMACLAQLVNVIAPIMTETGGGVWKQTIFYPYMYASLYGNGTTMEQKVNCECYDTKNHKNVPYIESVVIDNEKERELVLYAVNRSLCEDISLSFMAENYDQLKVIEHVELYSDDVKQVNKYNNEVVAPNNVDTKNNSQIKLKRHSWNMVRMRY